MLSYHLTVHSIIEPGRILCESLGVGPATRGPRLGLELRCRSAGRADPVTTDPTLLHTVTQKEETEIIKVLISRKRPVKILVTNTLDAVEISCHAHGWPTNSCTRHCFKTVIARLVFDKEIVYQQLYRDVIATTIEEQHNPPSLPKCNLQIHEHHLSLSRETPNRSTSGRGTLLDTERSRSGDRIYARALLGGLL